MSVLSTVSLDTITMAYKNHFVRDFSDMVLSHKFTDSQIDHDLFNTTLTGAIESFYEANAVSQSDIVSNTMTRFVVACAEQALSLDNMDPVSPEAYESIRSEPSHLHEDLNQHLKLTADTYTSILDNVVIDVVAKDAHETAKLITATAQNQIRQSEKGGRIHNFNWGVLSDGLWLNAALMKAGDVASIFRPGEEVKNSYIQTAFNFTQNYMRVPESKVENDGELSLLVGACDDTVKQQLEGDVEQFVMLKKLLLTPGFLASRVNYWKNGLTDPAILIESVGELSSLATTLKELEGQSGLVAEDLVSQELMNRVKDLNTAITLCLVAFEAVRETRYKDSLIMYVDSKDTDPLVDVFVNEDNLNDYVQKGGEESDILPLGMYLDPKRGMPRTNGGWSTEWANNRKVDILAQMITEEEDLSKKLGINEKNIVENICSSAITDITSQYARSSGMESLHPNIVSKINTVSRKLSGRNVDPEFSLESSIAGVLTEATGNPTIQGLTASFIKFASSENETERKFAKELTLIEASAVCALRHIHGLD